MGKYNSVIPIYLITREPCDANAVAQQKLTMDLDIMPLYVPKKKLSTRILAWN